jgi:hypothetical protein
VSREILLLISSGPKGVAMITFLIPVRHHLGVVNYPAIWQHLVSSLNSLHRQTDCAWKAVVCASEILETPNYGDHVQFLKYDGNGDEFYGRTMSNWDYQEFRLHVQDKATRRLCGLRYAMDSGWPTSWYFMMDADDLVSNDLVQTLHNIPENYPFCTIEHGIILDEENDLFLNERNFNQCCGTSVGIRPQILDRLLRLGDMKIVTSLLGIHEWNNAAGRYYDNKDRYRIQEGVMAAYRLHTQNHGRHLWRAMDRVRRDGAPLTNELREIFGLRVANP